MLLDLLAPVTLFDALFKLDVEFARETREKGCPFCGGRLHSARYRRKPRGGPPELREEHCWRLSLCCAGEKCRRRTRPPSCLFMGRRVYLCAAIIASCALRQQSPPTTTLNELTAALGVSRQTLKRWLAWFATVFPRSDGWRRLRGLVVASVQNSDLPAGLLARFQADAQDLLRGFTNCLRFLAPAYNTAIQHDK